MPMIMEIDLVKPSSLSPEDIVLVQEDVFCKKNGRYVHAGVRVNLLKIKSPGIQGEATCEVLESFGINAYMPGVKIDRPVVNLLNGYSATAEIIERFSFKSGGHLEGVENGKPVKLDDAKKGGMSVGSKHSEGGIKGEVGTEQRPIEFEGEEIILTAPVASNPNKYEFEGQQMTGREIASKINQDNGGVSFADGGQANCKCSGKMYKFGGDTFSDRDIIIRLNGNN